MLSKQLLSLALLTGISNLQGMKTVSFEGKQVEDLGASSYEALEERARQFITNEFIKRQPWAGPAELKKLLKGSKVRV